MGCNCGGSKQVRAQEVSARRAAAKAEREPLGPQAPGYYSGPKPAVEAAKAPAQ